MADVSSEVVVEDSSQRIARVAWGALLIWTGVVVFLRWGWGVGLVGAGAILLGAQAARHHQRLKLDGFALAAGALLVLCGAASLLDVAIAFFPVACVVAGLAVLLSSWLSRGRGAAAGHAPLQPPPHPRA